MYMRKIYFLMTLILLFSFACKNQKADSNVDTYENTYQEFKQFIEKPDSLLTQEQITKKELLSKIVLEHITVKDNQFHNSAEIKDFTDKGLSKYYYDILKVSLKETNQWVKDEKITNLDSVYRESKNLLINLQ